MKKSFLFILMLAVSFSLFAQKKKVAVVTLYVNKYVEPDEKLAGSAQLLSNIAALSKDPDFNLSSVLEKFHTTFFGEYISDFPFDLVEEKTILGNEKYKQLRTRDTTSIFFYNSLLFNGYKYFDVSVLFKSDLNKLIECFPEYDGFMFVFLSYKISAKMAIGGMGTAGIYAYVNVKLWNKSGDKVFNLYEGESSKGSVPLVAGIPVMKPEKILPLCTDATDRLLVEFKKKLPKIVKKVDKKL